MGLQIYHQYPIFTSFVYIPKSSIARSYGSSIFNFWRTSILFSTVAEPIYIPINSKQVFPFFHIFTITCFFLLIDDNHLTGVKRYLIVILICIALMINEVEHLFVSLLTICMSSLEKYYFSSSVHFKTIFYCSSITVVCTFPPLLPDIPAKPTSLLCYHPPPWSCPCVP